jgi:GT2 family glycosyltransferase
VSIELRVAAGTVTYGNRSVYLYQNIDKLLVEGFDHIYVLLNGVSTAVVLEAKKRYAGRPVVFIKSERNVGSSGGFCKLLKYIHKFDRCERLLLLDDDNLVPDNFLLESREICQQSDDIFYFHRPDRNIPLETFLAKDPRKILGSDCNFLGRTVFLKQMDKNDYKGDLLAAPYGGLFLPRSALEKEIFPDQNFFLYADDYDYTFRLCSEGNFNIFFIRDQEIIDLEKSFHLRHKGFGFFKNRYYLASEQQLFFSVRNQIYLSLRQASSPAKFFVNLTFFAPIYLMQFFINLKFKKGSIFLKAVVKGARWAMIERIRN